MSERKPTIAAEVRDAMERLEEMAATWDALDAHELGVLSPAKDLALVARALGEREEALTFDEVTAVNLTRCNRWHPGGIGDWSISDWAVAMAGEAGEACNAIKKLRRIEDEIANKSEDPERQLASRADAVSKIGEELADTFLYLNLLACRLGIHLPTEIVKKFNATSERYGFPDRLRALRSPGGERGEA